MARRGDRLDRIAVVALVLAAATALAAAARLAGGGVDGGELLAALRERTERRMSQEQAQLQAVLAGSGGPVALAAAEAALGRLPENSQLHLYLAAAHRERGETAAALREYRRAFELVRDYADRRSPRYGGAGLAPWLRQVRPLLTGPALADLYFLERALAGGCA